MAAKITALHYCLVAQGFETYAEAQAFKAEERLPDPIVTYWFTTDGEPHSDESAAKRHQAELDRPAFDWDGYNNRMIEQHGLFPA
jgi:hypothetical protein